MVLYCSAGDSGDSALYRYRWGTGDASMELAAAAAFRLAPDHLLASAWNSDTVPDPLRPDGRPRVLPLQLSPSHGRALGTHDTRGAGAIPARHAQSLRLWHAGGRGQAVLSCEISSRCRSTRKRFVLRLVDCRSEFVSGETTALAGQFPVHGAPDAPRPGRWACESNSSANVPPLGGRGRPPLHKRGC